ncbi:MAG: amidohydrolase family protein [Paracoccus sp. (in: a-proteobacteria)]|nr:amidohydrolase family protein [Paracoccus sp. (in: a-proteobacteria)]
MSSVTFSGRDPFAGGALRVDTRDGIVTGVEPVAPLPDMAWLAPGLVDLQVNGFGGLDLNDDALTPATVSALCRKLAAEGVTRFLPTIITALEPAILAAVSAIARAVAGDPLAARMVAGIHVEGPFLSPQDGPRGAHRLECIRDADPAEIARWQAAADGLIRIITIAPEVPGAIETIRAATAMGIRVSLGHSAATAGQIHLAADAGATLSTHLGNGCAATLPRHPNMIWAQLADDRLTASFITDGHHLPADTVKAMLRAKGPQNAVLVSDSVALAGLPAGKYCTPVGGAVEILPSGRVAMAGTSFLAGSGDPLRRCVARAARMTGLPLGECLAMASIRAAAAIGLPGGLVPGARADLILFDWAEGDDSLALRQTVLAGEVVFSDGGRAA